MIKVFAERRTGAGFSSLFPIGTITDKIDKSKEWNSPPKIIPLNSITVNRNTKCNNNKAESNKCNEICR